MPAAKRLYGTRSSGATGSQSVWPRWTKAYGESDHHTADASARRASMIFWYVARSLASASGCAQP